MSQLVFVYGTLTRVWLCNSVNSGNASPLLLHISEALLEHCTHLGGARVRGELYAVAHYPGLVLNGAESWVMGELYEVPNEHVSRTLALLDEYEEYVPNDPNNEYLRECIRVECNGQFVDAWCYLYNRPTQHLPRIASGNFNNP